MTTFDSRRVVQPVLILLMLLLGACSIKTESLVPDRPVTVQGGFAGTLKIMPVVGGRGSSFGREAYITNEQYGEALYQTLRDSGLFGNVVTDGDADLYLHSEIITITTEGGVSPLYAIVVQYWLIDPATGEEIWRKGINTRHQVKWNEAFAGGTRVIMAVEGATRKNLSRLVQVLSRAEL